MNINVPLLVFLTGSVFFLALVISYSGRIDREGLEFYSSYLSAVATSVVLVWIVVNSISQQTQLDLQRKELEMTREVLAKTASATFNQFFILYVEKMELVLVDHEQRILTILQYGSSEEIRENNRNLRDIPNLMKDIREILSKDVGGILRNELVSYVDKANSIGELLDTYENEDRHLAFEIVKSSQSQSLAKQFSSILNVT